MMSPSPEDTATRRNIPAAGSSRLTSLLVATTLGVYLLVVVGAATALLDGATACSTWPTCGGTWLPARAEPALLAAWAHRAATLAVGVLLAVTVWLAWRREASRRVTATIGAAGALYPGQIWLGALTATADAPVDLSATHLVVGVAIFSGSLFALLWQLEDETSTVGDTAAESRAEVPQPTTTADHPPDYQKERGLVARVQEQADAYVRLTKPKLWWLLCLVAVAAMGLAAGPHLRIGTVVPTLVAGVLAIGASGTFNNVLERDLDRKMSRTDDRPLVEGRIPVPRAIGFGLVLTVVSMGVFTAFVNVLAAALGLLAVLFYSIVYTLVLKPHTDQNIVIGGAVGAFPALIGWAAVTDTVGMPAVVLGAVIFLWTPAHFYNLALAYRADYERAGFPMLPVVRGAATTRRHILLYFGTTMVAAVALGTADRLGWLYAGAVVVVAAVFLRELVRQYRTPSNRTAFRTFYASNAYLGVLLSSVILDAMVI